MNDELDFETLDGNSTNASQTAINKDRSQASTIKAFGWITFGFAIWYFFVCLFGTMSSSVFSNFSKVSQAIPGNSGITDELANAYGVYFYQYLIGLFVSISLIVGGVGFATFKEWGRKVFLGGLIGALIYQLLGMYAIIAQFSAMQSMMETISSTGGADAEIGKAMGGMFGSLGITFSVVFSIIPIAYLVIVAVIAAKDRTKRLMTK